MGGYGLSNSPNCRMCASSQYARIPYVSHEKLIEDNKPDYYMALRASQKTFHTDKESVLPWLEFFLGVVY